MRGCVFSHPPYCGCQYCCLPLLLTCGHCWPVSYSHHLQILSATSFHVFCSLPCFLIPFISLWPVWHFFIIRLSTNLSDFTNFTMSSPCKISFICLFVPFDALVLHNVRNYLYRWLIVWNYGHLVLCSWTYYNFMVFIFQSILYVINSCVYTHAHAHSHTHTHTHTHTYAHALVCDIFW